MTPCHRPFVRRVTRLLAMSLLGTGVLLTLPACRGGASAPSGAVMPAARPLVIAHRGASGHRPEHTIAAYTLAVEMGADYIEPDLVSTRDGVLVARHENEIGGTTDVAERYPSRKTRKVIDGDTVSGWFTEDFTIAELRTLRARERLAFRSHDFDGQFAIPTFDEVLALADSLSKARGRVVGVYPETKHPTYFRSIGLPLEPALLRSLRARGLDRADAPVFIQSFEVGNLRALRPETRVRLVLLLSSGQVPYDRRTGAQWVTPEGLREIRTFADAIGVNTRMIVGGDSASVPTSLIGDAHAAGLKVHVWTLRSESVFLGKRYGGDPLAEVQEFVRLGVDGMFGDFPDVVRKGVGG
ncbi:glycerophosphoryl diester phosphodiesterase family protein [Gemmatimonas aurantiaca T-27]|uniref:glycerophosphodiester phosphodiesterase n=2 Tax=Gemmatimonas aurantiaca TaxID=173480 RepID=C1AE64_GEMAT|nr:glycerophosphoryl diester phosphodiesterase family protein [Gemmatimonas aurantiaca T-27]